MPERTETSRLNPDLWVWGEDEMRPRLLHAMIRVADFKESLRFYCDTLGMHVLDRFDVESRRATGVFLGYGNYRNSALLELTQKWDVDTYTHGDAFGHIAIGVPDLASTVSAIADAGYEVTDQPKVLMPGGPMVAFAKDPDGFAVELIQIRRA
ncbi:VOC family protein [Novosphingobium album (ex Hu et al. 2023)]|uniref:Aldoketomutase n=1 Tax=Novosphingobium album (ex Hu et al. 2023) TaxID=2930093 RepID=A0ABT0B8C5_9SPHN|nr:VOC family protein [Novosphingobium album (ex Hu et al. 2023)]MCJ2181049.1 VOC family protein [Novosphingobium album (ex Hu et al. 2023)]